MAIRSLLLAVRALDPARTDSLPVQILSLAPEVFGQQVAELRIILDYLLNI
jgi:hypothetical protein